MEKAENSAVINPLFEREVISFGLNYYFLQNMAIKADFSTREIGSGEYNTENTFGVTLIYSDWFLNN